MDMVRTLFDFQKLEIPAPLLELCFSKNSVEEMLREIQKRFLRIEETAGPVKIGDFVVFDSMAGDTLQVNVGKYVHAPTFEDSLVGLMPGAKVEFPFGCEITLVQIKRIIYPAIDDALVARLNTEGSTRMAQMRLLGAKTVDDLRVRCKEYLLAVDKKRKTDAIFNLVKKEVLERTVFGDLSAKTEEYYRYKIKEVQSTATEKGKTYQEMLAKFTPPKCETTEAREAYLREEAEYDAKYQAICRYYLAQSGKEFSQETYQQYKQGFIARGYSPEQADLYITFDVYLDSEAQKNFRETVLACYEHQFAVIEKP